jgi:hypothetical protein
MKFRRGKHAVAAPEESTKQEGSGDSEAVRQEGVGRGRWSTTFLIVGSALMGATALALWNRRTIETMRAQIEAQSKLIVTAVSIDEEIY